MRSHKQATSEETRRQGSHVIEMQRRRLLLAFGEVVAENGLETATVGRVCEQAGISRRTFYELFSDREDCLLAAFDQAIERLAQRVVPAYTYEAGAARARGAQRSQGVPTAHDGHRAQGTRRAQAWRERVRTALTLLLEQLDAEPDIARLCVVEAPRAGATLLERRRRVLDALAVAVDEGRTESRPGSEPPPLTAQGVVGGALSVIHARLLACPYPAMRDPRTGESPSPPSGNTRTGKSTPGDAARPLVELTGPLMAMIVHPYLGPAVARKELERPAPVAPRAAPRNGADPFKGLPIRFTYRTARVLATIASDPGASNRHIADSSGIADEGQMSRLLRRLAQCELIENHGEGHTRGGPNAWALTERGQVIHATITVQEPAA